MKTKCETCKKIFQKLKQIDFYARGNYIKGINYFTNCPECKARVAYGNVGSEFTDKP